VLAIPPKRSDKRIVTFLTAAEVDALLAAPDQSRWEGRRDRALMLLAIQAGLRVSELTSLNCGDVTLGTGASVRCEGKGRKHRAVPLTGATETLLRLWLRERAGQPSDPLFPTRTGRRLSRDAVALRISTHATTAARHCPSLPGKRIHPHVLRHSCVICSASGPMRPYEGRLFGSVTRPCLTDIRYLLWHVSYVLSCD